MGYLTLRWLAAQEGLTLHKILDDIPTDPASVFVYILMAVAVGWVVWGSWGRGKPVR